MSSVQYFFHYRFTLHFTDDGYDPEIDTYQKESMCDYGMIYWVYYLSLSHAS